MSHEPKEDPKELEKSVRLGYEYRDLSTTALGEGTVVFFVFAIIMFGVAIGAFMLLDKVFLGKNTMERDQVTARSLLPAGPLLQSNVTTKRDILDLRKDEERRSSSYGFSTEKGYVTIPTNVAIDRVTSEGFDKTQRELAEAPGTTGTQDAGSSVEVSTP